MAAVGAVRAAPRGRRHRQAQARFFFDEAHLLFDDAPPALLEKVEQVVRLIRSKGVGVYFITQNPIDIPDKVAGQLGNRVQHALRAFTPRDQAAVKSAAETFRQNPAIDVATAITELKVGEALVSLLLPDGSPSPVERTLIKPPSSRVGPLTDQERAIMVSTDAIGAKYDTLIDRDSAEEILAAKAGEAAAAAAAAKAQSEAEKAAAAQAKLDAAAAKEAARAKLAAERLETQRHARGRPAGGAAAARSRTRRPRSGQAVDDRQDASVGRARSAASSVGRSAGHPIAARDLGRAVQGALMNDRRFSPAGWYSLPNSFLFHRENGSSCRVRSRSMEGLGRCWLR